ncbi:MAG: DNA polymerase III subunit delta [Candidatus Marinimicrobia bacterium]|nr:DNA polymerase III subunit delta [Candidatus Neomarinimicrobiota bacterium]
MSQKNASIGQIIRRIRAREISPIFALYGGDSFLEDYFLQELSKSFLKEKGVKLHLSLDQDSEEKLFGELSAISMFEEKRIIIVREIKKLRSKTGRQELIKYIKSPNPNIVLLIISAEFDMRNSFLKNIADNSQLLDMRTPFENKMKEWVQFIIKSREIKITIAALDYFIQTYGDSTAHVINEIEKVSLLLGDVEIDENNIEKLDGFDRVFQMWHLQDSLGKKELQPSLEIAASLTENGTKFPQILVNLVYLYQQLLWKKMGQYKPMGFTGINKIITSNLSRYDKGYTHNELMQVIQELRKLDVLSKSTSINEASLIQPLIVKICKNQYV